MGSEGSNSSLDDIDDQLTAAARKRSKSADSRGRYWVTVSYKNMPR